MQQENTDELTTTLLELTQQLLSSIASGNWIEYARLCDPSLTAFEPEARGQLVAGLEFHKFYFDMGASPSKRNTTMTAPHVRVMGDVAVVAYVRLTQSVAANGAAQTSRYEESRVWQRQPDGQWRHVHFHRSANS